MCGINGFNFSDENLIVKMNKKTKHRGPDGTDFFVSDKISLGHNRLSIIDLSEDAKQPMFDNDRKLVIVFNGEIYNYQELKKELSSFYNFKTKSDTEVILAAYKKWGEESVKKLNGIFSFAIWDNKKEELFLARDHCGVKPLYYYLDDEKLIFSSEIKAILEHNVDRVLDFEAFNYYFSTLFSPEQFTLFKGIKKFPAASYAFYKNNKLEIKKYWEIKEAKRVKGSKNKIAKELKKNLGESVKKQLISDRPLGVYLSGGIDSSCIVDCVSRERDNIDTFSIGFDLRENEESDKFNKDFNIARETAAFYNTNHHEVLVTQKDVLDFFEEAIWHLDEPVSNPTIIPMIKLSRFTKSKGIDVVLGGDGGDELFGGYERYRLSLISSYYQRLPFFIREIFNKYGKFGKLDIKDGASRHALFLFQKEKDLREVINKEYLNSESLEKYYQKKYYSNNNFSFFEEKFMDVDRQTWLKDESLLRSDKMAMANGLEARVPFLDKDLIEYANIIPRRYKLNIFDKKIILKKAFKRNLPQFLFKQPKRGWFSPAAKWLRYPEVYKMAQEILSKDYYKETKDLFIWDNVDKILKAHYNKEKYNLVLIWSLMTFQVWAKKFGVKIKS